MDSDAGDAVFFALASAPRRRMLDLLVDHPGLYVEALASHFPMTRHAVMKHLKALEDAGLVLSERDGRKRRLYFNAVPIQQIYDRWTDRFSAFWSSRMADIKSRLEANIQQKETRRA